MQKDLLRLVPAEFDHSRREAWLVGFVAGYQLGRSVANTAQHREVAQMVQAAADSMRKDIG